MCQDKPKSLFVPLPIDLMQKKLQDQQNLYNQKLEYLNNIMSWILDLKMQTNDSIFNLNLDKYYKQGKAMYGTDLTTKSEELDLLVLAVKEEIVAYNKRISENK